MNLIKVDPIISVVHIMTTIYNFLYLKKSTESSKIFLNFKLFFKFIIQNIFFGMHIRLYI